MLGKGVALINDSVQDKAVVYTFDELVYAYETDEVVIDVPLAVIQDVVPSVVYGKVPFHA